ncbi:hypothetical protein Daus18300_012893 [Diaporthe australafricana]|uniref:Uncharacterized protein n=1 Tax=Diaporthe australafricana TaxID=127596 RepID=A0ABR3W120_9PEZI
MASLPMLDMDGMRPLRYQDTVSTGPPTDRNFPDEDEFKSLLENYDEEEHDKKWKREKEGLFFSFIPRRLTRERPGVVMVTMTKQYKWANEQGSAVAWLSATNGREVKGNVIAFPILRPDSDYLRFVFWGVSIKSSSKSAKFQVTVAWEFKATATKTHEWWTLGVEQSQEVHLSSKSSEYPSKELKEVTRLYQDAVNVKGKDRHDGGAGVVYVYPSFQIAGIEKESITRNLEDKETEEKTRSSTDVATAVDEKVEGNAEKQPTASKDQISEFGPSITHKPEHSLAKVEATLSLQGPDNSQDRNLDADTATATASLQAPKTAPTENSNAASQAG